MTVYICLKRFCNLNFFWFYFPPFAACKIIISLDLLAFIIGRLWYLQKKYMVKKAMLKPYSEIQKAVDDAVNDVKSKGKQPRVIVMPLGSLTVPML